MSRILDAQRERCRTALEASRAAVEKLRELRARAEHAATPAELLEAGKELPGQIRQLAAKVAG